MHRIGFPKVAIIPLSRPQKIDILHKLVRVISFPYDSRAALIVYDDFGEVLELVSKVGANQYFLVDENRFMKSINTCSDKDYFSFVNEAPIRQVDKDVAEKATFHIHDINYETYWVLGE